MITKITQLLTGLLLSLCLFGTQVFAQENCGTPPPTKEIHQYYLKTVKGAGKTLREGEITNLAIQPHIINRSDGTGGLSLNDLNVTLAKLNKDLAALGVRFYFASPNIINSDTFFEFSADEEDALGTQHDVTNAINIYFPGEVIADAQIIGGYAYFPHPDAVFNKVFIRAPQATNTNTISHELGHYFSLYHTFETSLGVENISGSNCSTAGDVICDTPADPNPNTRITVNTSNCTHNGASVSGPGGVYTNAPIDNIMSYHPSECANLFSTQQFLRMKDGLAARLGHTSYNMQGVASANVNAPSGLTGTFQGSGIILNWSDVSGETGYLIERSTSETSEFVAIGGVAPNVTTFSDFTIASGTSYFYRIIPSNTTNAFSNVATVTSGLAYCKPTYNFTCDGDAQISDFSITGTTLSNTGSACSTDNYGNFTNLSANLNTGTTYGFSASTLLSDGSFFQQNLAIWIDFNLDGDFEDNGERVFQTLNPNLNNPLIEGSFQVPSNTATGSYRMRVRVRPGVEGIVDSPCSNMNQGEVEDYTLNITGSADVLNISTGNIAASTVCAGGVISVPFTTQGNFSGASFTVQLSDNTGNNFSNIATSGSGSPLTATIPTNIAAGSGYRVRVTSSNPTATGSNSPTTLTINGTPTASISGSTTIAAGASATLSVGFTGTAPWSYTLSDGTSVNGTSNNPSFVTVNPTTTTVYTLTSVSNACGSGTTSGTATVTIAAPPLAANFSSTTTIVETGQSVGFIDGSTGTPTSWEWIFAGGNPATSTQQNPQVNYAIAGQYRVTLKVRNATGEENTKIINNYITVADPQSAKYCSSGASFIDDEIIERVQLNTIDNSTAGTCALYSNFTSQSTKLGIGQSYDLAVTIGTCGVLFSKHAKVFIDWNADGDFTDNGETVASTTQSLTQGILTIDLTVPQTAKVGEDLRMRVITRAVLQGESNQQAIDAIQPCGAYAFGETEDYTLQLFTPVKAEFSVNKTEAATNEVVQFTDQSAGSPTTWQWNFGDGTTSSEQNPTHAYQTAGAYTVSLATSNANSQDTKTANNLITVVIALKAAFSATPTSVVVGNEVQFSNQSGGNPTSFNWTFEGGTPSSSTEASPKISYNGTGTYAVTLQVTDAQGNQSVEQKNDFISVICPTVKPVIAVSGTTISADLEGTYLWKREGLTLSDNTKEITAFETGSYQVEVTDSFGCKATSEPITLNTANTIVPQNLIATASSFGKIDLSWQNNDVSKVTSFVVERSLNFETGYTEITTLTADNVTFSDTQLENNSRYFYRVKAGINGRFSAFGNVASTVTNVADFTANQTQIQVGECIYNATPTTENSVAWQWTFEGGNPENSADKNVSVGYNAQGVYDVTLTVTGEGGESATITKADYITVSCSQFTPTITIDGFTLTASGGTAFEWRLNGATITNQAGPQIIAFEQGTYEVTVTDQFGCTGTSEPIEVTVTGLENLVAPQPEISIYPNPASDIIYVEIPIQDWKETNVTILNLSAKIIILPTQITKLNGFWKTTIDVSALPSGLYVLRVQEADKIKAFKIKID